jgi:hypothetical protein
MEPTRFRVGRLSDRAVVEAVMGLGEEFAVGKCSFGLIFSGPQLEGLPGKNQQIDLILAEDTIAVLRFSFALNNGMSIAVHREWDGNSKTLTGCQDAVTVNPGGEDRNAAVAARLVKLLRQRLGAVDDKPLLDYLKEEDRAFYQAREQSLQRLQTMQEEFFRRIQDFIAQQADVYQKKQSELEQKYVDKENRSEEAHVQRTKELDEREAAVSKRAQELDDRASTHVRREIRKDLKKVLTERSLRFELTEGTKKRRWAVLAGYLLLLVALGIPAAYFLFKEPSSGSSLDGFLVVRQVLLTLAFATTAGFFLRWMSQWAQSHAEEEFKLKRLELDIDRASWVVEHALEWKTEKGSEIPQYLLNRLSRNLFTDEQEAEHAMTAADSLAMAILRSAAKAKVKVGDAEFELHHDGVKRLEKTRIEGSS